MPFNNDINGYIPLTGVWNKKLEGKEVVTSDIDCEKLAALYQFISLCKSNNIKVFIYVSPHFVDFNGKSNYSLIIQKLKNDMGIELYNYENDEYFLKNVKFFS